MRIVNKDKKGEPSLSQMVFLLIIMAIALTACQPDGLEPPRVATLTAQVLASPTITPTPMFMEAATVTPAPERNEPGNGQVAGETNHTITLWVNETSDSHEVALREITEAFAKESGIQVEFVLVTPRILPELVQTAVVSDTLPDLILHPVEVSAGWSEEGILDPEAATEALEQLGGDTFDPAALKLLSIGSDGEVVTALPSDGWQQIIIYRSDWFDDLDLKPPNSYEALLAAAEAIYEPDGIVSGLVVPTDASLVATQQVFEHLAIANGCRLVDENGQVTILHPACLAALDFYRQLVNDFSPIGFQTEISALNAYLSGRTGIIVSSPSLLPILAGLDNQSLPTCPACKTAGYLSDNSDFVTEIKGSSDFASPANFGAITGLGITTSADREMAIRFVDYWFNEGYATWLNINPERKVPMRLGTSEEPEQFIGAWGDIPVRPGAPSLTELYGLDMVEQLSNYIAPSSRWFFRDGQNEPENRLLVTTLYEELTLAPLLQEMLSGYFTSSQTVVELYKAVVEAIPNYSFPIEIVPTPTPS
jgi:multiple sugar transport system substrate-binding protein